MVDSLVDLVAWGKWAAVTVITYNFDFLLNYKIFACLYRTNTDDNKQLDFLLWFCHLL